MPSPYRTLICYVCRAEHRTRSLTARTCSKKCGAIMRQEYAPNGGKPREYPAEVVSAACDAYKSGLTIAEVQEFIGPGFRVQTILERHLPSLRPAIKRRQQGADNSSWKGDDASYGALHLRVVAARGKPSQCSWCERTEGRFEWANLTGEYADIWDYARLCVSCHRKFDASRRRKTGRRTSPRR